MDHRIKSLVFKALEKLPRSLGDMTFHSLQRLTAKSVNEEYDFQQATIRQFVNELDKLNLNFRDKKIVEIGSGWLPVLPYDLIFRYGSREVLTFDINEHYQPKNIKEFNKFYTRHYAGTPPLTQALPESVKYFPNKDIIDTQIEAQSIDVMTTRNVLEHIPLGNLELIHRQACQYLKRDGFIVHQISPSDHRAYSDRSLSLWDFLKYSQSEWDLIQTRFDSHNRLRLPDYVSLFNRCGFKIAFLNYKSARMGQQLPAKIHPDFTNYSPEELTAGSIIVILVPDKK